MISKATSVNKKNSLKYDYIFFIKDYFSLVKPKVMTLVVFTAFVGIFVAPVTIHPWIAFISIFCIALGSGAAGAFNMWYETDLDLKMIRTRKRVLPSAKIKKNEAPEDAVIREIKEELSLDINKKSLKPISFNNHLYEDFNAIIFFYICRSWKGTPSSNLNQNIMWVEISKLKNYKFLPGSNKFILELINLKKK